MTQEDKIKIRELIVTLQRIRNKENVFFNIAQYKRLGLIVERKRYGTNAVGNTVNETVLNLMSEYPHLLKDADVFTRNEITGMLELNREKQQEILDELAKV